jgi:ABC-type sugar transport system ATPase subunit
MSEICPLKARAADNDMKVVELSGGNQQKVLIAKNLWCAGSGSDHFR